MNNDVERTGLNFKKLYALAFKESDWLGMAVELRVQQYYKIKLYI